MTPIRLAVALLAALALSSTAAQDDDIVVGAYAPKDVTSDDVELLEKAQGNVSTYDDSVTERVCYLAVESLETQVVSGLNYKFQVAGCAVTSDSELGACSNSNCASSGYEIVIYSQSWTDTLEVMSISAQHASC
jgi:hypothetical protein